MSRGRKAKPVARQIAEGDPRKKGVNKLDQAKAEGVQPAKGLPSAPEYLSAAARMAWERWKGELEGLDMDRVPDAPALEAACMAYGLMVDAYQAKDWRLLDRAQNRLRQFTSEFGFTPVSRERLTIDRPDRGESDLAEILSKPRARKEQAVN
jgi:phage terminase small subunit